MYDFDATLGSVLFDEITVMGLFLCLAYTAVESCREFGKEKEKNKMKLKKMISIMAVGAASMSILAGCRHPALKQVTARLQRHRQNRAALQKLLLRLKKQRITQRIPETAAERHWSFIIPQAETRNVSQRLPQKRREQISLKLFQWSRTQAKI